MPTSQDFFIEKFVVYGMHGYKDIDIKCSGPATIVVAENGTGKTTFLSILNAFVTRRFHRLAAMNFVAIECHFSGQFLPLRIERAHLGMTLDLESDPLAELAAAARVAPNDLYDFVQNVYAPGQITRFRMHPIARQLYLSSTHDYAHLEGVLDEARSRIEKGLSDIARDAVAQIREALGDIEVLYLPTYRRVELPSTRRTRKDAMERSLRRPGHRAPLSDDVVFGLADVEQQLAELSEEIERKSNIEYRTLSARMLEDLLKGHITKERADASDLPAIDSLVRFLGRVARDGALGGVYSDIERIYDTREIDTEDYRFLRYFLGKLGRVVDQTREMEAAVERFVDVCNGYLCLSSDEKMLSYDPSTLRVIVKNLWAGCVLTLDDLSSGEKQIVSLMAKLYLSKRKKLVLIDEPELSLSLPWQKKVLPDLMASGSVAQMFAITHSPFIFDNELDQSAVPFNIKRSEAAP